MARPRKIGPPKPQVSSTASALEALHADATDYWETGGIYCGNYVMRDGKLTYPHDRRGITKSDLVQFADGDLNVIRGIGKIYTTLSGFTAAAGGDQRSDDWSTYFMNPDNIRSYLDTLDQVTPFSRPASAAAVHFFLDHLTPAPSAVESEIMSEPVTADPYHYEQLVS